MLHLLEIASVLLLFVYMYFAYKQMPIAWLFGVLGSLLSTVLFFEKGYFGSMFLNAIYAIQGVFGYFEWKWKAPNSKPEYKIHIKSHLLILLLAFVFSIGLIEVFKLFNYYEFNYADLFLATLSIVATFLEIKKDVSCWWYWLFCNLAYSILYLNVLNQDAPMYFYSVLMFSLAVFSWYAKKEWMTNLKTEH